MEESWNYESSYVAAARFIYTLHYTYMYIYSNLNTGWSCRKYRVALTLRCEFVVQCSREL